MTKISNRNRFIKSKVSISVKKEALKKSRKIPKRLKLDCFYKWIKIADKLLKMGTYANFSVEYKITRTLIKKSEIWNQVHLDLCSSIWNQNKFRKPSHTFTLTLKHLGFYYYIFLLLLLCKRIRSYMFFNKLLESYVN